MNTKKSIKKPNINIEHTVIVGTKGQIVIPKNVRKEFDINKGDKLLVITDNNHCSIGLIKLDNFREFAKNILQNLEKF